MHSIGSRRRWFAIALGSLLTALAWTRPALAQDRRHPPDNPDLRVDHIEIRPSALQLHVGERAKVQVVAVDARGEVVEGADLLTMSNGAEASFDPVTSEVVGIVPGHTTVGTRLRRPVERGPGFQTLTGATAVTVLPRPVVRIEVEDVPERLYSGTRIRLHARAFSDAREREDAAIDWSSSDASVVDVAPGGMLYARKPGHARVTAAAEQVEKTLELRVVANPIAALTIAPPEAGVRAGDVVHLRAVARDARGATVPEAPLDWSWAGLSGQPYDAGWLESEGADGVLFVANDPGIYRVTASVGSRWADVEVRAAPRGIRGRLERLAHATAPLGQATTDLWVFQGVDGRDYVYTGTFSGNLLYAWDVTTPARPLITDSLELDGRRVNDVKINYDATLAVVTSENASTRRNGITVVDIREPAHPKSLSHFTENLTGGIHNTWIEGDLDYAVNYGTRDLHIIDISDPANPKQVGRWGIDREDKFLHDVTIKDGLAYLSYWDDGVVILDVGAGIKGGTPTAPALVSQYKYSYKLGSETYGNTHHAIRYGDYVFAGDEIFGCSECTNGSRGYVHVIDVSDIEHPREVAYYRVPEAGSHNMWAEDGKLYIGYYQAGLRVVDISGELRGDLYRQGREIAAFFTEDDTGLVPHATSTWGAQPYKGSIYASDGNSGLWVVKLVEPHD